MWEREESTRVGITNVIARKEIAMSATVDQFCGKLRDRLTAIEGRLKTVQADVKSRSEEARKTLRGKLEEVRSKLHAEKERVDKLRANLKARADQKIAEGFGAAIGNRRGFDGARYCRLCERCHGEPQVF
jgi:uncharacterized protein YjbJ (UPF0337 family)